MSKILVVGSGLSGSVISEQLASDGHYVTVIEKKSHIGGNVYDYKDDHGILVHKYGPHIFHTNSDRIFDYLSLFSGFRRYEHRVKAFYDNKYYPLPININTINSFFGIKLKTADDVKSFLNAKKERLHSISTSADVVNSTIGTELADAFFRGYTFKQWGLHLEDLDKSIVSRIPLRLDNEDRYFTDRYQGVPIKGYVHMIDNMLSHPNIDISLNTPYLSGMESSFDHTVFTGPIDHFFECKLGMLPYRSLRFDFKFMDVDKFLPCGTVNYPNDFDFTRVTEFKYLTGQDISGTTVVSEFPLDNGEPYYPVLHNHSKALLSQYKELASSIHNVSFLGRLGEYRYYNMDQAVGAALSLATKLKSTVL